MGIASSKEGSEAGRGPAEDSAAPNCAVGSRVSRAARSPVRGRTSTSMKSSAAAYVATGGAPANPVIPRLGCKTSFQDARALAADVVQRSGRQLTYSAGPPPNAAPFAGIAAHLDPDWAHPAEPGLASLIHFIFLLPPPSSLSSFWGINSIC